MTGKDRRNGRAGGWGEDQAPKEVALPGAQEGRRATERAPQDPERLTDDELRGVAGGTKTSEDDPDPFARG